MNVEELSRRTGSVPKQKGILIQSTLPAAISRSRSPISIQGSNSPVVSPKTTNKPYEKGRQLPEPGHSNIIITSKDVKTLRRSKKAKTSYGTIKEQMSHEDLNSNAKLNKQ